MRDFAYIFPGQGTQYVGMGKDFYDQYTQAKEVFERANSVLGFDLTRIIFEGPLEELTKTDNCQVAVFTVSIACLRALQTDQLKINVTYTAGLSLGEYAALVSSEALEFEQALKLVQVRAEYMQEAAEQNAGGMLCLLGLAQETVEEICKKTEVEIANLNCPGQIVISGKCDALEKAKELAQAQGAKQAISLKVGGAFHSCLMKAASQRLAQALGKTEIRLPKIAVVSNVTAGEENSPEEIRDNLARQLVSRTLWENSIRFVSAHGIKNFLEVGPGKVLKGLLRRIDSQLQVDNIGTVQELEQFKEASGKL